MVLTTKFVGIVLVKIIVTLDLLGCCKAGQGATLLHHYTLSMR